MKPLDYIQSIDTSLIDKLFSARRYHQLLPVSRRISTFGDGWFYLLLGGLSISINGFYHWYFWGLLLAFAIERPCYYLLKNCLKRARPFRMMAIKNHITPGDQFSFPSGHTSAAFLFATITANLVPVMWIPLFLLASAVGFSRVMLGVHYPSDILVGALMGFGLAHLSLQLIMNY